MSTPPSSTAAAGAPPHEKDAAFLDALRNVGLLPDLAGEELKRSLRVARGKGKREGSTQFRMDLLDAHYSAAGDAGIARSRRQVDRYFVHHESEPVTASTLLDRLAALAPEVGPIALERIGSGADSTLVLRAGDDFVALLDDFEESMDTGDIDIRDLEGGGSPTAMVTVRGLVRGVNVLLGRRNVRERLVPLRSDVMREVYVALPLTEAIDLARAGWLEEESAEDVMELGGW
ncbi:MAG: hypothetical protein K1X94_28280 [Sandaracinaceae bacterium]|jgi:hypothetical protein|nr:hypothetical protein [Sandaracinaceae bacterium]